jgi:hypothetical protein
MTEFISYYRAHQRAKRNVPAHRDKIIQFERSSDLNHLASFHDDTGKSFNGLFDAIALCRQSGALLVIANSSEYSLSARFLHPINQANIDFIALDDDTLSPLTIDQFILLSEFNSQICSERNREIFQRAKANGIRLGNPNFEQVRNRDCSAAIKASHAKKVAHREMIRREVKLITDKYGSMTSERIAACLDERGIKTVMGKIPRKSTVIRAMSA